MHAQFFPFFPPSIASFPACLHLQSAVKAAPSLTPQAASP